VQLRESQSIVAEAAAATSGHRNRMVHGWLDHTVEPYHQMYFGSTQ